MEFAPALPRLSIITVCLNAEQTLQRTLNSVADQTYGHIELILCDGGSTDGTESVFRAWQNSIAVETELSLKFSRIHWLTQQSKGIYAAMNEAAAIATGDVITFLHANDAFVHPEVCALALVSLKYNTNLNAVYGDVRVVADKWLGRRFIAAKFWQPWMLQWGFMSPQPGSFFRATAFRAVGPFLDSMQIGADYEWLLRFHYSQQFKSQWVKGIQVNMLSGGISMRGKDSRTVITQEIQESLRMHGFNVSTWQLWFRFPIKALGIIRAFWRR